MTLGKETDMLLTDAQLATAGTLQLHHLQEAIANELHNRQCHGPFIVCSIGMDGRSLIVNEARMEFNEHGEACYVPRNPETVRTFTLYADTQSVFHDKPNPGDAFNITLRDGHLINSAMRLESGRYTEAKNGILFSALLINFSMFIIVVVVTVVFANLISII
jgi:hypothetical protein